MISQIRFVSVPVRDYDRALKFYMDKLGFKLVMDQSFKDGSRWIELQIKDSQTKFVLFTQPGQENRVGTFMYLTFVCDDLQKTYDELKARGVEFKVPPTKAPWGTYAQLIDSEDNIFILSSS